jgi:hypothetical protein
VFLVNSRSPLFSVTSLKSILVFLKGTPSSEVTEHFCRVPSAYFFQAPWFSQPVHLCRFEYGFYFAYIFLEKRKNNIQPIKILSFFTFLKRLYKKSHRELQSHINLLGADLLGSGRSLLRKPWTFGDNDFLHCLSLLMSALSFSFVLSLLQEKVYFLRNVPLPSK